MDAIAGAGACEGLLVLLLGFGCEVEAAIFDRSLWISVFATGTSTVGRSSKCSLHFILCYYCVVLCVVLCI